MSICCGNGLDGPCQSCFYCFRAWLPEAILSGYERKIYCELIRTINLAKNPLFGFQEHIAVIRHMVTKKENAEIIAPLFIDTIDFDNYTYARRAHMRLLADAYLAQPGGSPLNIDLCDLKAYQYGLMTAFIDQVMPEHSKILEVGGGHSKVLDFFCSNCTHECWNIDKFEGNGNGPKSIPQRAKYKIIQDYMGNFNKELPDNYFDLVFSLSALEHLPDDQNVFANVLADIDRVLKPGGYSVHLLDIVKRENNYRMNGFIRYAFANSKTLNEFTPPEFMEPEDDFYYMSELSYRLLWLPVTKKSYEKFGRPTNITIFRKKCLA